MNKAIKWIEIICRYFICLLMLIYGLVKVFQGQFYTDYYWKDTPLAQLSGMELVWSFYSYSPIYETILGIIEVTVGLLVFFKRTTKLGVLLFLPVMANLVLINIVFSVGALGSAFPLFAAGILLFIINFKSYSNYFFDKTDTIISKTNLFRNIVPKVFVIIIGVSVASLLIYNNKFKIKQDNKIKGAWMFNGHPEIKRIYFEKGNTFIIKDNKDSIHFGSYQTNRNNTITISNTSDSLFNWKSSKYRIYNDTLSITSLGKIQVLVKMK